MEAAKFIKSEINGQIAGIILDRPDTRNSFDIQMIRELSNAVSEFSENPDLRILVFKSSGKDFSSGADLKWMKEGMNLPGEKLLSESLELAELFRKIYESPLITIAMVKGSVLGGANGIVAACDFCIAEEETKFGLTEVRLGLLPATISPYIIKKTGTAKARELMLTARIISASQAKQYGLASEVCSQPDAEKKLDELISELLSNGPEALRGVKSLLRSIENREIDKVLSKGTAEVIARFRMSPEGQEGITAFFEKRKPSWNNHEQEEF